MIKHTPGPWGYEYGESSKLSDKPTVAHVGDYRVVRDGVGSRGYDLHEEDEYDARLIAAAPEMLKALSSLNAEVSAIGGFAFDVKRLLGDEHWDRLINAVGDARKAIAKAEGRS